MNKIRLGIVGAGLIWEHTHKDVLKKLEGQYEVRAFSARSAETRKKLAVEFPGTELFSDYHDMLKIQTLDAVVVLTPISLNARVTIDSLLAGKNVFTEKPLATKPEDIWRIIELEKLKKKKVFVLEQFRYRNVLMTLKSIIEAGRIGKIVSYELVNHGKLDQDQNSRGGYGNTDWRIHPDFPLGALFDGGIHTITQLTFLFSNPSAVYATGSSIRPDYGDYDQITMAFSHNDGIHGILSYSGYLDDKDNYFFIRGTEGTIQIKGDILEIRGSNSIIEEVAPSDESLVMWQNCAKSMTDEEIPVYGATGALEDVQILVAVGESLRTGEKVTL